MTSNSTLGWFHSKPDENAQNFLKEVDHYIILIASEDLEELDQELYYKCSIPCSSVSCMHMTDPNFNPEI